MKKIANSILRFARWATMIIGMVALSIDAWSSTKIDIVEILVVATFMIVSFNYLIEKEDKNV